MDLNSADHYGQRLTPILIDEIAQNDPERLFGSIPRTNQLSDGYHDVTFEAFASAINGMGFWIEERFGRSQSFQTLAYMGPPDMGYYVLIVAASKVGYKVLLPSPRNSIDGQLNLFIKTDCKSILAPPGYGISQELLDRASIPVSRVPTLWEMLALKETRNLPFLKTFEEAVGDPFIVLHTSGSTGLPKPIVIKHAWGAAFDAHNSIPRVDGCRTMFASWSGRRLLHSLPPFHAAGLLASLFGPIFFNFKPVWPLTDRPMSSAMMDEVLDHVDIDMIHAAPSILEELIESPASLLKLTKLQAIAVGGGPLSRQLGTLASQKALVCNTIGSTEMGLTPTFEQRLREDWEYLHFNPALKGIEFRDVGEGLYEQVLVRHPSTDPYVAIWWTFPDLQEYHLKDLYSKHPTKPNMWLYVTRIDDVIVLSNGEKLDPTSMERTLQEHPFIKGAVVAGQGRFAPSAVLELTEEARVFLGSPEEQAKLLEKILPVLATANKAAPAYAQLAQDMIIFSKVDKPFTRTPKTTILRQATIKLYAEEIEAIYQDDESGADSTLSLKQSDADLELALSRMIEIILNIQSIGVDEDLFTLGMDSLHVLRIVKKLQKAVAKFHTQINSRLVYSNPTVKLLTGALQRLADSGQATDGVSDNEMRERLLTTSLERYIDDLQNMPIPTTKVKDKSATLTVILTGSTGSLGSYLLDSLMSRPNIKKIYCLNRQAEADIYQAALNKSRGLASDWSDRVQFLCADLSQLDFGLPAAVYEKLLEESSIIIHNQWPVDFNLSLKSFEPHIAGVQNLIKLSLQSTLRPPIFFASSIGTVGRWSLKHGNTLVPEIALDDPGIPYMQGYSESKWIAERLLDEASKRFGLSVAICRIGQIAGPTNNGVKGSWNRQEWLPSLVASSKRLGMLPDSLAGEEDIAWIPVDELSLILVELVEKFCNSEDSRKEYYHLENPKKTSWKTIVPIVHEYLSQNSSLTLVSLETWIEELERSAKDTTLDVEAVPAVKLLDFYCSMKESTKSVKLDSQKTEASSDVMKRLDPVDRKWLDLWFQQWGF